MKGLLFISILFLSLTLSAQDMQKYLTDTKEMVNSGKYKEALERHVWFHEHALEYNKAMAGVRLSFALSDWKSLADLYPPAMKELIATRDKKSKQILTDGGTSQLFSDVRALNRTLRENTKTLDLFEMLLNKDPDSAKSSWYYVRDDLFAAKRYDILKKFIGNPMREYSLVASKYGMDTTLSKKLPSGSAFFKAYAENAFVEKSIQLIQFAIASDDLKTAKEIQQAANKVLADYRLRDAIPQLKN